MLPIIHQKPVHGASDETMMRMVVITQYFDTFKEIDAYGKVIFLNGTPRGLMDIENQNLMQGFLLRSIRRGFA